VRLNPGFESQHPEASKSHIRLQFMRQNGIREISSIVGTVLIAE